VATQKGQNASPSAVQERYSRAASTEIQAGNEKWLSAAPPNRRGPKLEIRNPKFETNSKYEFQRAQIPQGQPDLNLAFEFPGSDFGISEAECGGQTYHWSIQNSQLPEAV
jgi:hypothetical protein